MEFKRYVVESCGRKNEEKEFIQIVEEKGSFHEKNRHTPCADSKYHKAYTQKTIPNMDVTSIDASTR